MEHAVTATVIKAEGGYAAGMGMEAAETASKPRNYQNALFCFHPHRFKWTIVSSGPAEESSCTEIRSL